jgi:nucleoside-diphosphate-sugar epimerase
MRVVVVGGTGIISTSIVDLLLEAGHEVTVFNRGRRVPPERLPAGVRHIAGDRKEYASFEATMQAEGFDAAIEMLCFNAADAESDVRAFRGVQHFIQTSTVATLGGELAELPADEETPLRPNSDYGRNKAAADEVFLAASSRGELPATILKPYFIWSPGFNVRRQLGSDPCWHDRVRKGKPLLVTADGELLMSHCHADDAAVAFAAAVGRTRCIGEVYILASPYHLTVKEYHDSLAVVLAGRTVPLVSAPADFLIGAWPERTQLLATETRWNYVLRVDKIRRDIPEFDPVIKLEDRVPECIAWMEQRGLVEDCGNDDTEDRIIAAVDRLYAEFGVPARAATE